MQGQADLFLDYDASPGSIGASPVGEIVIKAKLHREIFKAPDYETAAQMLEATGDYRVLRRLTPRPTVVSRTASGRANRRHRRHRNYGTRSYAR